MSFDFIQSKIQSDSKFPNRQNIKRMSREQKEFSQQFADAIHHKKKFPGGFAGRKKAVHLPFMAFSPLPKYLFFFPVGPFKHPIFCFHDVA